MWIKMIRRARKYLALGAASLVAGGQAWAAPHEGGIDFQTPVTETATKVHAFHNEVLIIITVITVFVTALLLWVMVRYNKRANPTPKKFSHNTLVEILWTVLPVLILVWIAKGSFPLLYEQDVEFGGAKVAEEDVVDIKVYGNMWYWDYTYNIGADDEFNLESRMLKAGNPDRPLKPERGDIAQLSVDYPMVAPAGRYVRLKISAKDVIHAWAMPQFMLKVDAVPGRLNSLWFKTDVPGVYYGQCSELCGKDHSNMPIELRILPEAQYNEWLVQAKTSADAGRAYLDSVQVLKPTQVAAAN
jgi:cytochrome c oxidase subunit 2